jgi:hypothetical protein
MRLAEVGKLVSEDIVDEAGIPSDDLLMAPSPQGLRKQQARALAWVRPRLDEWTSRLRVAPRSLEVADLGYKWRRSCMAAQ